MALYQRQATNISNFVNRVLKDSLDSYATYLNGTTRITLQEGQGVTLEEGDTITFTFAGYKFSNGIQTSNLFDSNDSTWIRNAGWKRSTAEMQAFKLPFTSAYFMNGLMLGLKGVQGGERCTVLFTGEHGFGERPVGVVGSYSALAYRVRVIEISKK